VYAAGKRRSKNVLKARRGSFSLNLGKKKSPPIVADESRGEKGNGRGLNIRKRRRRKREGRIEESLEGRVTEKGRMIKGRGLNSFPELRKRATE